MTKEEWIQFIVISAIYVVFNITKELIKERKSKNESRIYEKSTLQGMTKADLIELIECAQHNYEILLDERDYFHDMVLSMDKQLEEAKKELKE